MNKLKIVPVELRKNMPRVVSILEGMSQSNVNIVLFSDEPEVWFQFYLGLFLEIPTFVLAEKKDLTKQTRHQLNYPGAKLTEVDEANDAEMEKFMMEVKLWHERNR